MSLTFSQSQGNGSTLSYTIVAEGGYLEDEDIVVELIAVDGGAITEQTLGTHYSIEDGNVIFAKIGSKARFCNNGGLFIGDPSSLRPRMEARSNLKPSTLYSVTQ